MINVECVLELLKIPLISLLIKHKLLYVQTKAYGTCSLIYTMFINFEPSCHYSFNQMQEAKYFKKIISPPTLS